MRKKKKKLIPPREPQTRAEKKADREEGNPPPSADHSEKGKDIINAPGRKRGRGSEFPERKKIPGQGSEERTILKDAGKRRAWKGGDLKGGKNRGIMWGGRAGLAELRVGESGKGGRHHL